MDDLDFDIRYRPIKSNTVANTLLHCSLPTAPSHHHNDDAPTLAVLSSPLFDLLSLLRKETDQDPNYSKVRSTLLLDPLTKPRFTLLQGLLFFDD